MSHPASGWHIPIDPFSSASQEASTSRGVLCFSTLIDPRCLFPPNTIIHPAQRGDRIPAKSTANRNDYLEVTPVLPMIHHSTTRTAPISTTNTNTTLCTKVFPQDPFSHRANTPVLHQRPAPCFILRPFDKDHFRGKYSVDLRRERPLYVHRKTPHVIVPFFAPPITGQFSINEIA